MGTRLFLHACTGVTERVLAGQRATHTHTHESRALLYEKRACKKGRFVCRDIRRGLDRHARSDCAPRTRGSLHTLCCAGQTGDHLLSIRRPSCCLSEGLCAPSAAHTEVEYHSDVRLSTSTYCSVQSTISVEDRARLPIPECTAEEMRCRRVGRGRTPTLIAPVRRVRQTRGGGSHTRASQVIRARAQASGSGE